MQTTPHKTTLEQWRVLQAVVDYGGFVPAAQALHRSHSTLSHAVNKLQEQLGVRLLTIRGRKAQLTPEGELMLRQSRALTRVARSLEHMAHELDNPEINGLALLIDQSYPAEWLAAILAGLDDPAASAIRWRSASTADCVAAIEDASADLIITEHGGGQPCACIELIPVVLTEKAKQLNGSATVSEKEIIWRAQDETSHARWQVASPDAALALLRQGAGWARLPRHLVERLLDSDELAEISSEDVRRTEVELNLFTPSHAARSEAGLALRDMLLDNQRLN